MTGKARMGPTCISPPSYSSTRVLHKSFGLPFISALHEPQWAALQFQRTARSGACRACIASTASRTTMPSTRGISYSTSSPPSASPRKIFSFAILPLVPSSSFGTGEWALEVTPLHYCRCLRSCLRLRLLYERRQVFRHRRYLAPLDADLALLVLLDYKVDPAQLLVRPVEVQSPLGPAALLALQGRPDDDLRDLDQVAHVLGRVPARVEEPGPWNAYLRQPILEREYLAQALLEGVPVAHQVSMLHHTLLELLLDQVRALPFFFLLQRLEHTLYLVQHLALACPTTEDEEIGERVAPKAVRAVQTTGDLAGGRALARWRRHSPGRS